MILAFNASKKNTFLVDTKVFPQTLKVLQTRSKPLGINIRPLDTETVDLQDVGEAFGMLIQLPNNDGNLKHPDGLLRCAEVYNVTKIAIVDPLCQVLMQPVGEMGFDIAVGSMQRFGVPMGYGGLMLHFLRVRTSIKEIQVE